MEVLYSTSVAATGGSRGRVRSDDGVLDLSLAVPTELGGQGGATNPVQLFAAGYAACFEDVLRRIALALGHNFGVGDVTVVAAVALKGDGSEIRILEARLAVTVAGVDQTTANTLVADAHTICPYSIATRGNMEMTTTVTVR